MVCLGGVVRMLSDLRCGRVTEDQEVLSPASSATPDTTALLLPTKLGWLPAARLRQPGGLTCAALLLSESSHRATHTLPHSALSTQQSQRGTAALPEHELWRGRWRGSSSARSANSIAAVPSARIPLSQSRPVASPSPSLQLFLAHLQPARSNYKTAH